MIMRPAWRYRTTSRRRWVGISLTFLLIGALGLGMIWIVTAVLGWLDAPAWLATSPWWVPALGALVWSLRRPKAGEVTEDGDDSWLLLCVRAVMVGIGTPRDRPLRAITAVLLGAPVAWGLLVVAVLTLVGIA